MGPRYADVMMHVPRLPSIDERRQRQQTLRDTPPIARSTDVAHVFCLINVGRIDESLNASQYVTITEGVISRQQDDPDRPICMC
jgi:hypothetical protein